MEGRLRAGRAAALLTMLTEDEKADEDFLGWLQDWVRVSTMLNEMSASLGQSALYPYVVSVPVTQKLRLVDWLVKLWGGGCQAEKLKS